MIKSFANRQTQELHDGKYVKAFDSIRDAAKRKLDHLHAAPGLETLRAIPGNRLEALKGNRLGQWSIRINDQYRICFTVNKEDEFENVEITDYH